eukprot:4135-Eustigmatos_ZCMA.PRE.1
MFIALRPELCWWWAGGREGRASWRCHLSPLSGVATIHNQMYLRRGGRDGQRVSSGQSATSSSSSRTK